MSAVADQKTPYSMYCAACGGWFGVGGTSLSAPLWSSITARWDSAHDGTGFGDAAARLYQLATRHPDMFHDIGKTTGQEATNGFYPSTVGYDMATGLGTPDITNIVKNK